ncbi:hypothetical protein [Piscinibacter terrae]|uniref:Uncharacterized protein n=1 Tax=Piscinibacter terrae TaxID=2496871 RepID=A0A3N7JKJ4_9BURK|nr:hypothetical protein [Albitalea terrae]RQP21829.1 hypothetical protein DZC73_25660 [Albitalea terrae]
MNDQPPRLLQRIGALTWTPEFNVVVFAFLINFPWEFMQAPLFEGMDTAPHWEAVKGCIRAALGDALIALIAFWCATLAAHGREWIAAPTRRAITVYLVVGLGITTMIEALAVRGHWMASWTYAASMPVVPGLGVGVVPLLQWLVLPVLVVHFTARQVAGRPR